MASYLTLEETEADVVMEHHIKEYDKTVMPVPDIEFEPYILLNKVRKHYMEYVIKLLSVNYERNLRIPSNSLHRLPSAIWRCAKSIEMSAAQASMVLQIYRSNILSVVEELKNDTMTGKLNKNLYKCLYKPPQNEKRTQTTFINSSDCKCQCNCSQRKRVRKSVDSPTIETSMKHRKSTEKNIIGNMPFTNQQTQFPFNQENQYKIEIDTKNEKPDLTTKSESQKPDELVQQLEKLFEGDGNDHDIFEGVLCGELHDESSKMTQAAAEKPDSVVESHSAQNKSLDERLVSLADLIISNNNNAIEQSEASVQKPKKWMCSKWLCEEYFLKMKLLEMLDHIRDKNRNKLKGIKQLFADLFGDEDEEEDLMSPINETHEFVLSCKERIAPWVVKMLTPYYVKGRIKGKTLFKALAKHLIKLIYQCSQYPEEYEVHSFVADFLKNHKIIRCEADFKEFKIINL